MITLEQRVAQLEEQVSQLMGLLSDQMDEQVEEERRAIRETAVSMAFRSTVAELAVRSGLPASHVDEAIRRKTNYYHEKLIDPLDPDTELSARLDERTLEELPDDDAFPLLFPASE